MNAVVRQLKQLQRPAENTHAPAKRKPMVRCAIAHAHVPRSECEHAAAELALARLVALALSYKMRRPGDSSEREGNAA